MQKGWWRPYRVAVMAGLALAASTAASGNADFLAAREAYRTGDNKTVAEKAEALSADPLGIYPRYWLLTRQVATATPEQMQPFLSYYQGSYLAERLRGEWLAELGRRGDWTLFRQHYPQLIDSPSQELRCYHYAARQAAGDKAVLAEVREQLWFSARDLPGACNSVLDALQKSSLLSDDDRWARLRLALEANAQGLARHLSAGLGRALTAAELQAVVANPARHLDKAPLRNRMERELAIFALARLARTDVDGAYARWEKLKAQLNNEAEAYALRQVALAAARQHREAQALEWFAATEGRTPWADAMLEWRVRVALRAGQWETVLASLRQMSEATRALRPWQYWEARALEATGGTVEANRILAMLSTDDDYYGLLARERLGPLVTPAQSVYRVTDEDWRRLRAHAGLQRALALHGMDLRTEAVREWNWALRGADDRLLLVAAEAANQAGWYDRAIYAADRTKQMHNYSLRYLSPYREVTRGYAQELGLDEAWIYGLIRQESRFVTAARSSVGAGGLMQLMPGTAQWVANRLGLKYHAGMVNEVGSNVRLGTYYMKHVLDSLSSQPVLATAAYNAGPNRARQWQPQERSMEAAVYVESIPFLETRDYVKKVMANAVAYSQLFGENRLTLTERLGTIPPRNPQAISGP